MPTRFFITISLCLSVFFADAQFNISPGTSLTTSNGAILIFNNIDLVNNGTINQQTGQGKFIFSGSSNNNISGSSNPLFDVMEISKTGSAVVSLLQNINIGTGINFTSGLINLNKNNIFLQPSALLNNESETSRITGITGGYVQITALLNAPSAANPGNLGAVISSSQNLGSTVINRGHVSQTNNDGNGNSINRYFDISPANDDGLNATLRFQYFDAELNGLTENTLVLYKSTDNIKWVNQGLSTRDVTNNYVELTGISSLSRWTLSSPGNSLPLQFLLFNVHCENTQVDIIWKTAQEQNTKIFEIQKSDLTGNSWTIIGTVPAAGNSVSEKDYSFIDYNPLPGGGLYRIAEYDINGNVEYTSINETDCSAGDNIKAWPNPVEGQLFININTVNASSANIKLFDSRGALVNLQNNDLLNGSNQLNINMSNLAAGVYFVRIEWNNSQNSKTIKVIKK